MTKLRLRKNSATLPLQTTYHRASRCKSIQSTCSEIPKLSKLTLIVTLYKRTKCNPFGKDISNVYIMQNVDYFHYMGM